MYERHFGLSAAPFQVTPDPNLLMLTDGHQEAIAAIMYGIMTRRGFIMVSGEVGVGKTTVLRHALDRLGGGLIDVIHLVQPVINPPDLLRTIQRELAAEGERPASADDMGAVIDDIHARLLARFEAHRTVVVAIDEAQALPAHALETLRQLSNFEARSGKLLQVVLVGQPELEAMLAKPELRQVNQRIAIRARIGPLSQAEGRRYVEHRLAAVSDRDVRPFTSAALRRLLREARGYPRRLNILCDNALMNAYGHGMRRVTWRIARETAVSQSMAQTRSGRRRHTALGVVGAVLLLPAASLALVPDLRDNAFNTLAAAHSLMVATKDTVLQEAARIKELAGTNVQGTAPATSAIQTDEAAPPTQQPASRQLRDEAQQVVVAALPEVREQAVRPPETRAPEGPAKLVRTVPRGSSVGAMCEQIYGHCGSEELQRIREANPGIRNLSRVNAGQAVVFPGAQPRASERR